MEPNQLCPERRCPTLAADGALWRSHGGFGARPRFTEKRRRRQRQHRRLNIFEYETVPLRRETLQEAVPRSSPELCDVQEAKEEGGGG